MWVDGSQLTHLDRRRRRGGGGGASLRQQLSLQRRANVERERESVIIEGDRTARGAAPAAAAGGAISCCITR